jgi:hypothetical protein
MDEKTGDMEGVWQETWKGVDDLRQAPSHDYHRQSIQPVDSGPDQTATIAIRPSINLI